MKRFLLLLCLCTVVIFSSCEPKKTTEKESIVFWYGKKQTFGALGHPQKQINILGRIYNSEEKSTAFYSLNGGPLMLLTLGSDLHRLANRGDFNVELYRDTLQLKNRIVVYHYKEGIAVDSASTEITFHKDRTWPLPYSISWKSTDTLTKAVQVVDGLWQFDEDGLSNDTIYYDRVVCFGDSTWTDYEVRTTVTFHDFTPPRRGAPVYNVSHAAIATRWPGHDADSLQPNRKWHPLGATAEFRLTKDLDSCRWRIFDGEGFYVEAPIKDYRNGAPLSYVASGFIIG